MSRSEALAAGMKIGLLGGSFNPAHEGHLHLSRHALRTLALDRIWWLVSPQNPLKPTRGMAAYQTRLDGARAAARHPAITVSDIEMRLGTRYAIDTVRALQRRHKDVRFVWLMGADNMCQLPRWHDWAGLMRTVPVAIYPRPGASLKARLGQAAQRFAASRLEASDAALLPDCRPPAFAFLDGPEHGASATNIRAQRGSKRA